MKSIKLNILKNSSPKDNFWLDLALQQQYILHEKNRT